MGTEGSSANQTEFSLDELGTSVPDGAELEVASELETIVENMRQRIVSDRRLDELLRTDDTFTSTDTVERQAPESFTQDTIIEPLIDELGYPYAPGETTDFAEEQGEWADYAVPLRDYPQIDSQRLLIEAEPINKELDQTKHGLGQVRGWLRYRPFDADFGIATDGLEWYLIKYNENTHSFNEIEHINLKNVFIALFENLTTTRDPVEDVLSTKDIAVLHDFIRAFHFANFRIIASGVQAVIRQKQKTISEEFYDEYIQIVFGILDEDTEGRDTERCLVGDGIIAPDGTSSEDRRLFAVDLMNRLIFIQFLEDTGIVHETLLKDCSKIMKADTISVIFIQHLSNLLSMMFSTSETRNVQIRFSSDLSTEKFHT